MSKSGSPSGAGHSLERQDSSGVMDSLECLPDEIVVLIPGQRPPALCALMATCSRFRVLASDEAIWQACHEGRWTYGRPSKSPACGWRVDFRRRHRQDAAVLPLVQQLGSSDQAAWRQLMALGQEIVDRVHVQESWMRNELQVSRPENGPVRQVTHTRERLPK